MWNRDGGPSPAERKAANDQIDARLAAQRGAASGVASLGTDGKVPTAQLSDKIPVQIGDGTATVPTRPVTTGPVWWNTTTAPDLGTGTFPGGQQMSPNDLWLG